VNKLISFLRLRLHSFLYAFKGIYLLFGTQINAKIHLLVALFVLLLGFLFQLFWYEWALILFAIGLVFAMEAANTAIEFLVDLVSPQHNEQAGKVKDLAASAVLIAAITALVIGLLVFVPKFLRIL
jgi:diacylglycerol kinase (ATP)